MTASLFSLFLADTIAPADPGNGLTDDELYGVYISWCLLRREVPAPPPAFWAAMREEGIPDRYRIARRVIRPGLRMTGPAAADYILTSQPSLLCPPVTPRNEHKLFGGVGRGAENADGVKGVPARLNHAY